MDRTNPIVFFGTPTFAVPSLLSLVNSGRKVSLVVTQPDRPSGRGQKISFSPIKQMALAKGIPFVQPEKMDDRSFVQLLSSQQASLFVVVAFGRILPPSLLELSLTLNVHASLLPRWRGASPITRAILAGDSETGISIIRLIEKLDAGDVLFQTRTRIDEEETTGELTQRLSQLGAETLLQCLNLLEEEKETFSSQDKSQVTLAPPIRVEEAKILWNQPAQQIHNLIRAFNPWPGAFTVSHSQRIKIFKSKVSLEPVGSEKAGKLQIRKDRFWVACLDLWLEILELQREGKARQPAFKFLPGFQNHSEIHWE